MRRTYATELDNCLFNEEENSFTTVFILSLKERRMKMKASRRNRELIKRQQRAKRAASIKSYIGLFLIFIGGFGFGRSFKPVVIQCDCKASEIKAGAKTETVIEEPEKLYMDMELEASAYCPCKKCCGKTDGITSTGVKAKEGRTVAVDPNLIPYGSEVIINGHTYIAEDCGGAISGNKIDIFFDSHEEAIKFGRRKVTAAVEVLVQSSDLATAPMQEASKSATYNPSVRLTPATSLYTKEADGSRKHDWYKPTAEV